MSVPRLVLSTLLLSTPLLAAAAPEHDDPSAGLVDPPIDAPAVSGARCVDGRAADYSCSFVDLESFVPLHDLGAAAGDSASDVWGWRDPRGGREYALIGLANGTSFVDVTDAKRPRVVAFLPTATVASPWRELKVYNGTAFIVADGAGDHGLQIVKLDRLRALSHRAHGAHGARGEHDAPQIIAPSAVYSGFGNAHNIEINPKTGFAYVVGSDACGDGGILMLDVRKPGAVSQIGCHFWPTQPYVHDIQCEIYRGPDARSRGREICFASAADALWILDVTDKSLPVTLSRVSYAGQGYVHQGWLTEDHRTFLLDDELDERNAGGATKTYVWDVSNLTSIRLLAIHSGSTPAIDHNQYVRGQLAFQANYRAGLRILDARRAAAGALSEMAFFDVAPDSDDAGFGGAWGVYPFLPSGNLLVSSIERGLFVLRPGPGLRKLANSKLQPGR